MEGITMIVSIRKRDGRILPFDSEKITTAVMKAFEASGSAKGEETARQICQQVITEIENNENISLFLVSTLSKWVFCFTILNLYILLLSIN